MQLISCFLFCVLNVNKVTSWLFCSTFSGKKCYLLKLLLDLSKGPWFFFLSPSYTRASDIETAQQIFWKQADFGYIQERLNEMKTHCKPAATVSISDRYDTFYLYLNAIFVIDEILLVLFLTGRFVSDLFSVPSALQSHKLVPWFTNCKKKPWQVSDLLVL